MSEIFKKPVERLEAEALADVGCMRSASCLRTRRCCYKSCSTSISSRGVTYPRTVSCPLSPFNERWSDILDIDMDWHMHEISDGERRRVQLCFGLMVPWDVLLLDEVRPSW